MTDSEKSARWERRLWWLHSVWALGVGTSVVIYAANRFDRARWLILTLVATWLVILGFYRIFGDRPSAPTDRGLKGKAGYWVLTYLLKNLYQAMLFFLLPFYWQSMTLGTPNQWFVLLLGIGAVVATMDLLFDNVLMTRRWLATTYFTLVLFAALNLAIPALLIGLDARWALLGACAATTVSFLSFHPRLAGRWWRRPEGLVVSVGVAVLAGFALTPAVPPVPHHLVHGRVGIDRIDDDLGIEIRGIHASKMDRLEGLTRVLAPGEGSAQLTHVWRHDGHVAWTDDNPDQSRDDAIVVARSELPPGAIPNPAAGRWSLDVQTADGRLIGRVRFRVYGAR